MCLAFSISLLLGGCGSLRLKGYGQDLGLAGRRPESKLPIEAGSQASVTDSRDAQSEGTMPVETPSDGRPDVAVGAAGTESTTDLVISRELIGTKLLTRGEDGEAGNGPTLDLAMSADGRFVAFTSLANNLVLNDGNNVEDVFFYDNLAGETTLVSMNQAGHSADGWSSGPAVSADGRFVAFYSWAGDLTPEDTNVVQDVFLWDRAGGSIERITRSPQGAQANDRSGDSRNGAHPALSADGSIIAFHSNASNLVSSDTNGHQDVFVYDTGQRQTSRVSVSSTGIEGDGDSRSPALSADGSVIAFTSRSQNLDTGIENPRGFSQIFLHDRTSGATRMISAADGRAGDGDSFAPALSGDGRSLVFASDASNLIVDDVNGTTDVFEFDVSTASLARVSVASSGAPGNGNSFAPAISLDGRYVGYASAATNLVNGDTNGAVDIFVYDLLTRHTGRASLAVRSPWTAVEANDDSAGPPALAVGGRLVAYVSEATNLVTGQNPEHAQAYALERQDLPVYTIAGRVLDAKNRPISGVSIVAGQHRADTDERGRFELQNMPTGTYTLIPGREELHFAPSQRVVSVVADVDDVRFTGLTSTPARLSFLSIPFDGELTPAGFIQALRDTEEGGWVDAWFDHDAPQTAKNGAVLIWDGRVRSAEAFQKPLGCYEGRCYDGHDGTDFPYQDPVLSTNAYEPLPVRAAAAGNVVGVVDSCSARGRWCNNGYGNEVLLFHENGYFTRYSHLASVTAKGAAQVGAAVDEGDVLGIMGNTGNSYGTHLHFAVHQDDGNGQWDGSDRDLPVDPFGWSGEDLDPWAARSGAVSRWMWNEHPTVERIVFGDRGAEFGDRTGTITVEIPGGALEGQARFRLEPGAPAAAPEPDFLSAGRSLRLQLLDWYVSDGPVFDAAALADASLALPLELGIALENENTRHLDMQRARVVRWDGRRLFWEPLPTMVSQAEGLVTASSDKLGSFDVQAPLLCPGDTLEPDDAYYAATYAEPGEPPLRRLFDLQEDEDWIRFDASRGQKITVRVYEIAQDLSLGIEVVDVDGLTVLATAEGDDSAPVQLAWSAPEDGSYFVRATHATHDIRDCAATYTITLD